MNRPVVRIRWCAFVQAMAVVLAPSARAASGAGLDAAVPDSVISVPGVAWKRHVIDETSAGADGVKLGDLNGDGRQDIVTGWMVTRRIY